MTAAATIQVLAARLTEDDLVALANRGTLRRARKDLESSPPPTHDPAQASNTATDVLIYQYDGQRIQLRNPIAQSSCDCPAGGGGGCCRHVLVCLLHAAQQAAADPVPTAAAPSRASCIDELLTITDEQLIAWAGRAAATRAIRELASGLSLHATDSGEVLVARITEWSIECRWMSGGGLQGFLCSCRDASPCVHRVAAVMALQRDRGLRTIEAPAAKLDESGQTPRSRNELRLAIAQTCVEIIEQGFSRLSRFHATRLRVLSVAAHGADLPRLERMTRAAADHVDAWLARSAAANDEHLLAALAQTHALACALATPMPALVGEHRSRYERTPPLELVGAGADTWRTPSGYCGLTVYFWDVTGSRWCSWTESRPADLGFDPGARAFGDGPWTSCPSPRHAATHRGRLSDGWRSRAMRLSGRPSSKYASVQHTSTDDLPAPVTRWADLAAIARQAFAIGLVPGPELAGLVLLAPQEWEQASFNAMQQTLFRSIIDDEGHRLRLVVPHRPETAALSHAIEHLKPQKRTLVLAKLVMDQKGLAAAPISIIDSKGVSCIGLQPSANRAAGHFTAARVAAADEPEDDDTATTTMPPEFAVSSPLLSALAGATDELVAAAAHGTASYRHWNRFGTAAKAVLSHGYQTLEAVMREARVQEDPQKKAAALLAAAWIHTCSRQATITELGSLVPLEDQAI